MADDLVEFEADGRIYAVSSAEAARLVESGRVAGSIGGGGAGKARVRRTRRVRKRVRRGGRSTGRSRRRKRKVDKADSRPPAYDDVDGDVGGSNQAGPSGAGVGSAPVALKAPVRPTRLGGAAASASAAGAAQDDTIAAIQREVKKLKVRRLFPFFFFFLCSRPVVAPPPLALGGGVSSLDHCMVFLPTEVICQRLVCVFLAQRWFAGATTEDVGPVHQAGEEAQGEQAALAQHPFYPHHHHLGCLAVVPPVDSSA